jgi:hypothetical protein
MINMSKTMTTNEFSTELGTDSRTLRKFLRSITPKDEQPGKGSRWVLPANARDINKAKKNFTEWSAKQAEEKAARAAKAAEEAAAQVTETEDEVDEIDA